MMAALIRPRSLGALADLLRGRLAPGLDARGSLAGLCDDSRRLAPGEAFFARRGPSFDGVAYAPEAIQRGACVVVTDVDLPPSLPSLRVPDVEEALRRAADAWYSRPQDELDLVGITGTKGKTTTAWMAAAALRACETKVALLGTIVHDLGDGRPLPSENTTPGVLELRRLLARARDAGCRAAVLEVSSHALDQQRVRGLAFRAAVFTNLASDHLDYHRSREAYFEAKARLFADLGPAATAILNREDPAWPRLAALCHGAVLTYGTAAEADLRADGIQLSLAGTRFRLLVAGDGQRDVQTALVGRHNVMNALAALGACAGLGCDPILAAEGVAGLAAIPGRMERVDDGGDLHVFVDYAHTEDSLRQALGFLREIGAGPITCVVGCGGDRDPTKRPAMARVAAAGADRVLLTSDNPRGEDPEAILDAMAAGLDAEASGRVERIASRSEAIAHAVLDAPGGATVLVAGKGHETYQILGTKKVPFDDGAEVRRALGRRAAARRAGDGARGDSPA